MFLTYFKWTFWIVFWAIVAAFLHYTLPQHDIVRIADTYEQRIDPGGNSLFWTNAATGDRTDLPGRDVFFIQTIRPGGQPMVYRNEDTGWGWPPYFKFDTANLQTKAADLASSSDNPRWVAVRHYGWRWELGSIFPNAVEIRPVDGPDSRIVNWFNIVVLTLLAGLVWAIWARWRRFRERRIDPWLDDDPEAI